MLNREKIRLMVEIADYETREGRSNRRTNSYFKGDYIGKHMLANFLSFTFCYLLVLILVIFYRFDTIISIPDYKAVIQMFKPHLIYYTAGLISFEMITAIVYAMRYNYSKKMTKTETIKLKKLGELL